MAVFFPTVGPTVVTVNGQGAAAGSGTEDVDAGSAGTAETGAAGQAGTAGSTGSAGSAAKGAAPPGSAGACADRHLQVPGDGYSPPCVAFTGSNGGATSRGVTGDSVVIALRV